MFCDIIQHLLPDFQITHRGENGESPQRFTSVMYVDYIRSWKRDYENFESSKRAFTDEDKQRFK